ncbi:uncharacterized protein LOC115888937 [Sitophilus oryzae]|uniref:Uncharacterized protein LOC115888937 n=1 Tax=Sitophilus oryzae TaxID=7048 RepID=A0A6J2YMQ0_SITOR|nr:uncharacterized protein LOC115888937 [Sitophilus oryzae]
MSQEALLIDLIQNFPYLYDKSKKEYKNNNIRNNAWDIAAALTTSVEDIQRVWRNLRERYDKERKQIRNMPSGSGAPDSVWLLYDLMRFMDKHMLSRKRVSNLGRLSSSSSGTEPLVSPLSSQNIWDTPIEVYEDDEAGNDETGTAPHAEATAATASSQATTPQPGPSTSKGVKRKLTTSKNAVDDTLTLLQNYIKEKSVVDKNLSFGQYVGLTLADMPLREQNHKKLKIVEILNETYNE